MKKIKKSLGTKFLEEFINLRERNPIEFARKVTDWLKTNDIAFNVSELPDDSLIKNYFKAGRILKLQKNTKKTKQVIIGKGVVYDTGGYNIKTYMSNMHFNRNGALLAIASHLDTGTDAAVFFVVNNIHDTAPVDGDIILEPVTGKRVLIENTDAEGRIGLAHLLADTGRDYDKAITIATLTGAAVGFTGELTMALVHSNKLTDYPKLMNLAISGNEIWPAPGHKEYDDGVLTKIVGADVTNSSKYRYAGSSTAFSFLKHFFTGHLIHVDMAAMDSDKDGNGHVWGIKEITNLLRVLK